MTVRHITSTQIRQACAAYPSMRQAALSLGLAFSTFKRHAEKLGAYAPNPGLAGVGKTIAQREARAIPLTEILTGKHPSYCTSHLSKRLQRDGLLKYMCAHCGLASLWEGKPLVLHLDHIDGNARNHRLTNLRFLCPNCHSQTDTYCGKNSKGRPPRSVFDPAKFCADISSGLSMSGALKIQGHVASKHMLNKGAQALLAVHIETVSDLLTDGWPTSSIISKLGLPASKYLRAQLQELALGALEPTHGLAVRPDRVKFGAKAEYDRFRAAKKKIRLSRIEQQIRGAAIDFSKFGWVTKLAALLGIKPQKINAIMREVVPDLLATAMRRKQRPSLA